jgi:predicted dehydrogenase
VVRGIRQEEKNVTESKRVNRRAFLKTATAGAAAAFAAGCARSRIIPPSALGLGDRVVPSERIVMGAIGVGSQGTGNMRGFLDKREVQMVAVCDVDKRHRDRAKAFVDERYGNEDCEAYLDFRELIGRGDLDAVSLGLPDHWHAIVSIAAATAGLDIYGEKPLARSIREGRAICDAVRRYGCVWQTGSWQRSVADFRRACELVRNGRIGKVHKVEVGLPTGERGRLQPERPVPDGLDWDFWLGPAPWIPYRPFGRDPDGRCHWDWRWIMDYSGGQLTDWAGHHIDIAHWGLGSDYTGPVAIEGKGEYPGDGLYNAPTQYMFTCTYANGISMIVANDRRIPMGAKWYGDRGWIHVWRGGFEAEPASVLRERIGAGEIKLYRSRDHQLNFLDCVKTRTTTITPVEVAHRSISVGLLGEIAMLTGRKIKWDPDKEEVIGDPGASQLLGRSYREPWCV